jgi:hypothetical protein
LEPGEQVLYAVRTRKGLHELGRPTAASSSTFAYDLPDASVHEVVVTRIRHGVPIATSKRVIGRFRADPPSRPASISSRRRGTRLTVNARLREGAEAPDEWQYVFDAGNGRRVVHRAKVGRALTITVPRRIKKVTVRARPVVGGRALR